MSEPIIIAALTTLATIVAAIVGRGYTRRQRELEAETAREEARQRTEDERWDRLQADVTRLDGEVKTLRAESEQLRRDLAAERAERLTAEGQVRDQDQLISDLLTHLLVREAWEGAGSPPPPPVAPWRVHDALRRFRDSLTSPIPIIPTPTEEDPT